LAWDYAIGRGWRRTKTLAEEKYAYYQQVLFDLKLGL